MTAATDIIRRLHQHRAWVNQLLLEVAESLPDSDLQREFPIGQGTIWKTLTHLFAGEFVWLETLLGNEQPVAPGDDAVQLPGNQQGPDAFSTFQQLRSNWNELEQRWDTYLTQLGPDDLSDIVYKVSSLTGQRMGTTRSDILLHVCTHAHYTTAQILNMLRHCGVDPLPDPMLITLARSEALD